MPSPIGMDVTLSGKKEDIDKVFDQIAKNSKEIDLRLFDSESERKSPEEWDPEWDPTYSDYSRPNHEGGEGYFSLERYFEGIEEYIADLSIQHPNVVFVYRESHDYGGHEVTYKKGRDSKYKEWE